MFFTILLFAGLLWLSSKVIAPVVGEVMRHRGRLAGRSLTLRELYLLGRLPFKYYKNNQIDGIRNGIAALWVETAKEIKARKIQQPGGNIHTALFYYCQGVVLEHHFAAPRPLPDRVRLTPEMVEIVDRKSRGIEPIAEKDMRRYYSLNPTAWRHKFDELKESFQPGGTEEFHRQVCGLAGLNDRVEAKRKMFFDAHLVLVKHDRERSLECFFQYFDKARTLNLPRAISQANRKLLFDDQEQLRKYNELLAEAKTRAFDEVSGRIAGIYVRERKKIELDPAAIRDADLKQASIAETLGAYLDDEPEPAHVAPAVSPSNGDDTKNQLVELFKAAGFRVNKREVDIFAKSRGVMPGQLIETVNETYYELLDDVLIEEEESHYVMDKEYCAQIEN